MNCLLARFENFLLFATIVSILVGPSKSVGLSTACRNLSISLPNSSYFLNNNPGPNPEAQLEAIVTRAGNADLELPCTGFIAIAAGSNDSPSTYYTRRLKKGQNYIPYNYYSSSSFTNANVVEGCSPTASTHFIPFTIPAGQTSIPAGQRPIYVVRLGDWEVGSGPATVYSDSCLMRVYEGSPGTCSQPGGSASSTIQFRVDAQLDISVTDSQIDFGELEVGDSGTSGLVLTFNQTGFRVSVRSENGSKLKHAQVPTTWNYQMRFKRGSNAFGSWRSIPSTWTYYNEIIQSGGSSPTSIVIEAQVIAPAPTEPLAGSYTDTVYFEVSAY